MRRQEEKGAVRRRRQSACAHCTGCWESVRQTGQELWGYREYSTNRLYCTGGRESILQTGAMHFLSVGGREYTITQAVQEAWSLFYSILYILVYTVQGRRCGLWSREYVNSFIV